MHRGQRLRPQFFQPAYSLRGDDRKGCKVKELLSSECGAHDVAVSERRSVAGVREKISTEKRLGCFLEEHARLPVVRDVRRIDVANALTAEIDDLPVGELARRSITKVVKRDHAP